MPDIFLSYAHEDMDRARDIASALDAQGWSVFWDRRIPPGRAFEDLIEQQIKDSALVVVLWSPHSVGSNWVRIEAAHARDRNPPALVPILIAPATIPFAFSNLHAADLCHWRPGQKSIEVEELFRSIESLVRRPSNAGLSATDNLNGAVPASTRVEPRMNIAIIGATGHGKTTLTAAIASTLAKSSPQATLRSFDSINGAVEEKARGMSGAAALVEYRTARHRYVQADFLCHEDCIDSMLAAAGMDGMILVVATPDGATQQTREQILAARQGAVECIAVALNKVDLAGDAERLRSVELEVRDLLTQYGFPGDDLPMVQISARGGLRAERRWEKKIEDLVRAVDQRLSVGQVSGTHGPAPSRGDAGQPLLIPVETGAFPRRPRGAGDRADREGRREGR